MKVIAYYLPQFHSIEENDHWWGEGFTEWTNTKKAKPLYDGHYQPRVPLNDFYYNLTNKKHRQWQADLAKTYGLYGFCYYHYWFKGKRLLEKPFNDVLASGEPDFPFCLSWANEPWTRTWDGSENDVLMPQEYGNKKDWLEHFNYLINAFNDPRYIKIDGKPLFVIYNPEDILQCNEMLIYWQHLAKQNGLPGIYFIDTLSGSKNTAISGFDASIEFEPMYSLFNRIELYSAVKRSIKDLLKKWVRLLSLHKLSVFRNFTIDYYSFDDIWRKILERKISATNRQIIPGAFVDWDNSPRKSQHALIVKGATPEKFEKYLTMQIDRSINDYQSSFLFINAWNEWAEGTYLEPDQQYKYGYLEAVRNAIKANSSADQTPGGDK